MMSTSDVGMGLNMEEFSFMSKRVPKKRNRREELGLVWCVSLAALSVLIFTALALVNDQAAKHLLWTALELCENVLLSFSYNYTHLQAA